MDSQRRVSSGSLDLLRVFNSDPPVPWVGWGILIFSGLLGWPLESFSVSFKSFSALTWGILGFLLLSEPFLMTFSGSLGRFRSGSRVDFGVDSAGSARRILVFSAPSSDGMGVVG